MPQSNSTFIQGLIQKLESGVQITKEDLIEIVQEFGGSPEVAEKIYMSSLPTTAVANITFYLMLLSTRT